MKIITIISVLLLLTITVNAQEINRSRVPNLDNNIPNLMVGQKVPDILISKIINNDKRSLRISELKDQLIILDFWDTYCGSCIESLPKLDAMQRKFGKKIKILPVTWQKEAEVVNFFKQNKYLKAQNPPALLPCVVEDRLLASYFRHQIISHEVWIHKGIIKAITSPEFVNASNIQTILDGKPIDWPIKNDAVDFDLNAPLLSFNPALKNAPNKLVSYSVLTGKIDGLNKTGGLNLKSDSTAINKRLAFYNRSIADAYQILLFNADSVEKDFIMTPARKILDVKDPSKYEYKPEAGLYDTWSRANEICYELVVSEPKSKIELVKLALSDLDNKLGIRGRWEKRKTKCLVIIRSGKPLTDTVAAEKGGYPIKAIAMFKLDRKEKYPPAIDETNFNDSIKLGKYEDTLEGLRLELQKHGFDIIEAEREIEVMVIS